MGLELPELMIPEEFECRRCGYCCREFGHELPFTSEDIALWEAHGLDWVHYHPFIDWYLNEFVCAADGVISVGSVAEAREALAIAEREFEEDWGVQPEPFPWGGTLWCCPFLKWMGNKWGCLIHEYTSRRCRAYLCYWDRLEAAFRWLFL